MDRRLKTGRALEQRDPGPEGHDLGALEILVDHGEARPQGALGDDGPVFVRVVGGGEAACVAGSPSPVVLSCKIALYACFTRAPARAAAFALVIGVAARRLRKTKTAMKHEGMKTQPTRHGARSCHGRGIVIAIVAALPAVALVTPVLLGARPYRFVLDPTGWIAAGLLVAALAISPLRTLLPGSAITAWLLRHRRRIGLATFFYACVHMIFFVLAIGSLADIVTGLAWASMWTGWVSFLMLAAIAAISSDAMHRRLGRAWKPMQRLAHAAAMLGLVHWLLLARNEWLPLTIAVLAILLQAVRIARGPATR